MSAPIPSLEDIETACQQVVNAYEAGERKPTSVTKQHAINIIVESFKHTDNVASCTATKAYIEPKLAEDGTCSAKSWLSCLTLVAKMLIQLGYKTGLQRRNMQDGADGAT